MAYRLLRETTGVNGRNYKAAVDDKGRVWLGFQTEEADFIPLFGPVSRGEKATGNPSTDPYILAGLKILRSI